MTASVLVVEDDVLQRSMLTTLLQRKLSLDSCEAENGREAIRMLDGGYAQTVKLIILDLEMPVMSGQETLNILKQKYPLIPVVMLTGSHDVQDAVDAMQAGAADFVTKPYEGERMVITVKNALKISALSKEVERLKRTHEGGFRFENLIGHDQGLVSAVNIGRKAAQSELPVLITGETGTGKEVFARAIHGESERSGSAFIAVNCGAIPSQLIESTLFGHEKGAFTGATDKVIGKFREAEGGTLFLDEIGELPLDAQVKLLRVLQQKEVEPVGAGKPVPINVRILSATNRDLEDEVAKGHFREDLFFRLNVLQVGLPALRYRKNDISALAMHFVERFCATEGGIVKDLSNVVLERMCAYEWPGNIRQLENVINRAMVISEGQVLCVDDFEAFSNASNSLVVERPDGQVHSTIEIFNANGGIKTICEFEYEMIDFVMEYFENNITKSAKALGIAKSTFYKKLKHRS